MKKVNQIREFSLQGRFLGFVLEEGHKIKYLRLATQEREYWMKLSKPLRQSLGNSLIPGMWIGVAGEQKQQKTGSSKFKALEVETIKPGSVAPATVPASSEKIVPTEPAKPQATILVCQKSDCCKKGAQAVCDVLEKTIRERGLENQVVVKGTGCLKQCKAGPNIVIKPDKARYSRLDPQQVPDVIEQHFSTKRSATCEPAVAPKFAKVS